MSVSQSTRDWEMTRIGAEIVSACLLWFEYCIARLTDLRTYKRIYTVLTCGISNSYCYSGNHILSNIDHRVKYSCLIEFLVLLLSPNILCAID